MLLEVDGASATAVRGWLLDRHFLENAYYLCALFASLLGLSQTITSGYHGSIAACAACGHWEGATSLLQRMRQDPLVVVTIKEVMG